MQDNSSPFKTPWWFALLLIVISVPSLILSQQASEVIAGSSWGQADFSGWLYPVYVVISAVCSWVCYPTRRTLAWILFCLIILADLGLILTLSA